MRIAIIGPYPPPFGGISIHIERMYHWLKQEKIDTVVYTNIDHEKEDFVKIRRNKLWLLKYIWTAREDVIHFHNIHWIERVLIGVMGFLGRPVILSIHGQSLYDQMTNSGWFKRRVLQWAIKHIKMVIVVNIEIKQFLISYGISAKKIECIPAFIPPVVNEKDAKSIPEDIVLFINKHSPVILANASKLIFYKGEDLYGLDMCVDVCEYLTEYYPKVGFIFCLPQVGDGEYFSLIKQMIDEKNLNNHFIFQTKSACPMYQLILRSDLFVRPTNTDGDSVSLREALYYNVPSVTSDVIDRPEGSVLFENRKKEQFRKKVTEVLEDIQKHKDRLKAIQIENNFSSILTIYKSIY